MDRLIDTAVGFAPVVPTEEFNQFIAAEFQGGRLEVGFGSRQVEQDQENIAIGGGG